MPCQRKRSPEGDKPDQPSAKRVVTCALTGSEGTLEAASVTSSALVESRGAVTAECSPPMCEGECVKCLPFVEARMESSIYLFAVMGII